jgi:hypothetical protein
MLTHIEVLCIIPSQTSKPCQTALCSLLFDILAVALLSLFFRLIYLYTGQDFLLQLFLLPPNHIHIHAHPLKAIQK